MHQGIIGVFRKRRRKTEVDSILPKMVTKQEIRGIIRQRKRQYTPDRLREMSLPVVDKVNKNSHVLDAKYIMLYHSLPDEVYTHEMIGTFLAQGKTVLLPHVVGEGEMVLCRCEGGEELASGAYDIQEPGLDKEVKLDHLISQINSEEVRSKELVCIIPGVAFDDSTKMRLGRGKGYYDRMLARLKQYDTLHMHLIGVCFDFQMFPHLPYDRNDIPMDEIVC